MDVLGVTDVAHQEQVANTHNLAEAIFRTNGLPEVAAGWVTQNIGRFKLIDVREPRELRSTGYVAQAENVPLSRFMASAADWDRKQPLGVMCASGGRSGRAVMALQSAGFTAAASLEGGIFGWLSAGLPTAR